MKIINTVLPSSGLKTHEKGFFVFGIRIVWVASGWEFGAGR
jgi:hypothetical protein